MADKILILGGDGYLGWPTAMRLSSQGHGVTVVDNYFRRNISSTVDVRALYPVLTLQERAKLWYETTGKEIKVIVADLSEPSTMRNIFIDEYDYSWSVSKRTQEAPDAVIHYAEQPSAPYSQFDFKTADHTLCNNVRVTNNLVWAVKDFNIETHIVKLGTMGEYGTPNIDIEEGWLDVKHNGREQRFLYPRQASSVYHTSKIMDTDLLWFAVRMWGLKVTDLMQGPVYGIETEESKLDTRLRTIFNYDEMFGTILNRFVVQAICGYPLTVYGAGGQTRGYLNIEDTLQCVNAALLKPASSGEMRIFNQIMETFSVNQLADLVVEVGRQRGHDTSIKRLDNPRVEAEEHYYKPKYQGLRDMGVEPHLLSVSFLHDFFELVESHSGSIRRDTIFRGVKWG